MRNLLTMLLLTTVATLLLIPVSIVAASQLVADPNDFFQVYSPGPEARITGIGNVSWQVIDSDSQDIPYHLYLKDIASCSNVLQELASGTVNSSSTTLNTSWNSANASDGIYCLELCVNLHFNTEPYITCNARAIDIQNTPTPKPTPSPIVVSPTKPVVEQPVTTVPRPSIIIISPGRESAFGGDHNTIRWQLINPSSVTSISIYYSADQKTWTKIADPELATSTYDWDVSEIKSADYFLKLVAQVSNANEISEISPRFTITNLDSQQTSEPMIYDILPSKGSEIRDTRPLISGKFLAALGEDILPTSFEMQIDGSQRSDSCEVSTREFKCQPDEDLAAGTHLLEVSIGDTSGQTATQSWEIIISPQTGQEAPPADSTNILGQVVGYRSLIWIVMICCALLFLIIVPWLLYRLWRNRDEQTEKVQVWNYPEDEPLSSTTNPPPNVEVNYVYPETINDNTKVVEQTNQELSALGISPQGNQENSEPSWLAPEVTSSPNNVTVNVVNPGDKHKEVGSFGYASKIDE